MYLGNINFAFENKAQELWFGDKRKEPTFNKKSSFILFPAVYVATNNNKKIL